MILAGGINTDHIHSLNGVGIVSKRGMHGVGILAHQSGDFVDPLRWRKGIQSLDSLDAAGVNTLTPGLHGLGCGNSVMDCACKCGAAQEDQALVSSLNGLNGLDGMDTSTGFDMSFGGSILNSIVGIAIPNWALYAFAALMVAGARAHK